MPSGNGIDTDVVIIGAGPTGVAAAIGLQPEGVQTMLLDEKGPGGQVATSSKIENVFGVPVHGIPGGELMARGTDQAKHFGVKMRSPFRAVRITRDDETGVITVVAANRERIRASAVVLALGASHRRLNVDGVEQYMGRGVIYGSPQYHVHEQWFNKMVGIIGGGNSAGQAALFLSECDGCQVSIFVRGSGLEDDMSSYLLKNVHDAPNVKVHPHSALKGIVGDDKWMTGIMVEQESKRSEHALNYLMIQIGAEPQTGWLEGVVELDRKGYILTDRDLPPGRWPSESTNRAPLRFETSMPGVFTGGDVHADSPNRMSCAIGEGAALSVSVYQYLTLTERE